MLLHGICLTSDERTTECVSILRTMLLNLEGEFVSLFEWEERCCAHANHGNHGTTSAL